MELKSKFKSACKKIWKAFNSWRKRGMWFRVTVLLIIGSVPLTERLITTNHVPLINEFVWTACRAIRYASEPRVTSAHLRYLHAQKSRQLQNELRAEYNAGHLKLNDNELKLLSQNTQNANYNKLFEIAKLKKMIPSNITLSQTKKAMLYKALKLTSGRFDAEWEDVKKRVLTEAPFGMKGIRYKLWWLWHSFLTVLPLPIIPALPWFILCLTLGCWGAQSKNNGKWIFAMIISVVVTLLWILMANHGKYPWFFRMRPGDMIGKSIFWAVWAVIGSILGKRLYRWALKHKCNTITTIVLLVISSVLLLMPHTFFEAHDFLLHYWMILPGEYLLFRSSGFASYFTAIGIAVLLYMLFFICKNYAKKLAINK